MIWGLILLSGIFFLPESPCVSSNFFSCVTHVFSSSRHLLALGKESQARAVIAQLNSVPETDIIVVEAIEELELGIRAENDGGKATWMECFSTRNMLWKRTLKGMMLQFIQQLNGQNFYCKLTRPQFNIGSLTFIDICRLLRRHFFPKFWNTVSLLVQISYLPR